MVWRVYVDGEHVGTRKTKAGAEALAERKSGRTVYGWTYRGGVYTTHGGRTAIRETPY